MSGVLIRVAAESDHLDFPDARPRGQCCHAEEPRSNGLTPLYPLVAREVPWSRNLAIEESLGRENRAGKSPLVAKTGAGNSPLVVEDGQLAIPWSAVQETLGLPGDESPKEVMRGRKEAKGGEVQVMLDKAAGGGSGSNLKARGFPVSW